MSPPRRGDSCIVTQQLQQNDFSHYNILEGANCLHTHSTETGWNTGMPHTTAKAITEHTACKRKLYKTREDRRDFVCVCYFGGDFSLSFNVF